MGQQVKNALMAVGITALVAALIAAVLLIFQGKKPDVIIPYYQECTSDPQCQLASMPTCADCWTCSDALNKCAYSLKDSKSCPCVEKEKKPCEIGFIPGKMTCERLDVDSTTWG